jgi:hypothetical protein
MDNEHLYNLTKLQYLITAVVAFFKLIRDLI